MQGREPRVQGRYKHRGLGFVRVLFNPFAQYIFYIYPMKKETNTVKINNFSVR